MNTEELILRLDNMEYMPEESAAALRELVAERDALQQQVDALRGVFRIIAEDHEFTGGLWGDRAGAYAETAKAALTGKEAGE